MNSEELLELMKEVYNECFEGVESFEKQHIGVYLAYLLGAIVNGNFIEINSKHAFAKFLNKKFTHNHVIWNYVHVNS